MSFLSSIAGGITKGVEKIGNTAQYYKNYLSPTDEKVNEFFEAFTEGRYADVERMVLEEGMDPNRQNEYGHGLVHQLAGRLEMSRVMPDGSLEPFGKTVREGVELLNRIGVDFLAKSGDGRTARQIMEGMESTKGALVEELDIRDEIDIS